MIARARAGGRLRHGVQLQHDDERRVCLGDDALQSGAVQRCVRAWLADDGVVVRVLSVKRFVHEQSDDVAGAFPFSRGALWPVIFRGDCFLLSISLDAMTDVREPSSSCRVLHEPTYREWTYWGLLFWTRMRV